MTKSNLTPGEIKMMLEEKGLNFAVLARRIGRGMTRQRLAQAIVRPHRLAEEIIANALDLPPAILWPERYDPTGKRKSRQPIEAYRPKPRFKQVRRAV